MILRKVQVEGFRCFRSPIELPDLQMGVNVIHAPNETGKSSLVQAIARALFDRYGAKSEDMLGLRPWGTQLSPKINLELETRGKRFRLEKSFLDGAMSRLSEWTGERFEPLAEANAADELARGFLSGTASAKGATDLEHWGLARLLWMTQSQRLAPPTVDGGLRERLLQTLGAASLGDKEQKILSAIEDSFTVYYTPKSEQLKKAGPLADAQKERDEAAAQVEFWRRQSEEAAMHTSTARAAQTRAEEIAKRRETTEAEIAELEARAKKEAETESALHEKRQEWKTINERWKHAHSALQDLKRMKDRIEKHRAEAARVEAGLAAETTNVGLRKEAAERAAEEFRVASERVNALIYQSLRETLEKAEAIKIEGEAKRKLLSARRYPKAEELSELKKVSGDLDRARMRLEVCGVEVSFEPTTSRAVAWNTERFEAVPGAPVVFKGTGGALEIEGVGKISVRTGAEDVKKTAALVAQLESALGARLKDFAVTTIDEVAALREQGAALEGALENQRALFKAALGTRTLDDVRRAVTEAETRVRGIAWESMAGEVGAAKSAADAAERRRRECDAQAAAATKTLSELTAKKDSETKSADALAAEWEAKGKAVGTIEALTEKEREEALQQMLAERQVKALEAELPPPHARAGARVTQAKATLATAATEERDARDKYLTAKSLLDRAAGEGVYTKLNEAEERLALADKVLATRHTRAVASKTLRALARERADNLNDRFVLPIQEVVGAYFSAIRGRETGLALGPNLDRMTLDFDSDLDAHSFGTQEQAMLVIRLALGRLLSERGEGAEPQMIVLDDPLVNTDDARRGRALDLIREARERMQILILTAFPEKFRTLGGKEFDLSAIRHGNA